MGRIFETRKHKMFARWAKNSKAFTKMGKEIALAVKGNGPDPDSNPRLRMAIQIAKSLNMPKDTIDNAIKKASSKAEGDMDEVNYEAYGPFGVALFIECATDNTTRTVANVRNIVTKHGGNLATDGALNFVFSRKGVFSLAKPDIDLDDLQLELIDHGLEELFETEEGDLLIYTPFENFGAMQKALEQMKLDLKSAALQRIPLTYATIDAEQEQQIAKIVGLLEDDDDVQHVYTNNKALED